ncbi:MAG: thiamine-binding protein, partial [Desulfobacterales bacterium]|nr:thiamine-binding protein [Desulfobacterales bacterium]
MNVIMDLTVSPLGAGVSVSKYIAACHELIEEAGLSSNLHAYGTN